MGVDGVLVPGSGRLWLCYAWIVCVDSRSKYLYTTDNGGGVQHPSLRTHISDL